MYLRASKKKSVFPMSVFVLSHSIPFAMTSSHSSPFMYPNPPSNIPSPLHGALSGEPSPSGENSNALRLAPPRGSLLVAVKQCENQLALAKSVYASDQVRPKSLCSGAGAFLPCNWINAKIRCTEYKKAKITKAKLRKIYKRKNERSEMYQKLEVDSEYRFRNSKLRNGKISKCKPSNEPVHVHFPESKVRHVGGHTAQSSPLHELRRKVTLLKMQKRTRRKILFPC